MLVEHVILHFEKGALMREWDTENTLEEPLTFPSVLRLIDWIERRGSVFITKSTLNKEIHAIQMEQIMRKELDEMGE
jgi:hypothetical protein